MATQRYVSTSFWDDQWVQALDPSEKLLYLYLMTNPLTNIAGVYKITVRRMCFDTGFNESTINHVLEKFKKSGKAYLIEEYIILPSWPRHQKWEKSQKIKDGIISILNGLDKEIIEKLVFLKYDFDLTIVSDTLSIPYVYPSNYSDLDLDRDRDIDTNLKSDFEKFRVSYPNTKGGLETEFKNFKKHKDWKANLNKLLPALKKEIAHKSKLKEQGKFCPEWKNLQTWLSKRCWENEFEEIAEPKKQKEFLILQEHDELLSKLGYEKYIEHLKEKGISPMLDRDGNQI